MKISCPACSAKYSIADEKVTGRLAKIRCRKCETTIVIDGKVNPPVVRSGDADPGQAASVLPGGGPQGGPTEYSIDFGENDQRNFTLEQLIVAYNEGQVTADTFVWAEGFEDWKPLGEIDEIVDALHAAAQAAEAEAPRAPAYAHTSPWESQDRNPAPARAATKAASTDLFGRIDRVGSEEDVTTSAPDDPPPAGPSTGARNESSVLFSLSALTSAATTSRQSRPPAQAQGGRDDSGLIDLKALTEAAARSEVAPAHAPMGMPLMASPLFGPPAPLGGGAMAVGMGGATFDARPTAKNRIGLFIGGGLVLAALVVGGAIMTRPVPAPPPPPVVAAPVAQVPTNSAEDRAAAIEAAKRELEAEAKAKAEAEAAEKAKKNQATASTRRWTRPSKSTPTDDADPPAKNPTSSDKDKKPPPKKSSPCGCAPGDLQCNMRCSAGG